MCYRTDGETWARECKKNHIQTLIYILGPLLITAVLGVWGLLLSVLGAFALVFRTMWRIRWRKIPFGTAFVFAAHSHFCQFPIWLGQLSYYRNRRKQKEARIIEYK